MHKILIVSSYFTSDLSKMAKAYLLGEVNIKAGIHERAFTQSHVDSARSLHSHSKPGCQGGVDDAHLRQQ